MREKGRHAGQEMQLKEEQHNVDHNPGFLELAISP